MSTSFGPSFTYSKKKHFKSFDLGFHFQSNFRIYCAENVGHANKGGEDRHNPVTTLFFNLDDGVLLYKNIVICVFIFFFGFRSNSYICWSKSDNLRILKKSGGVRIVLAVLSLTMSVLSGICHL